MVTSTSSYLDELEKTPRLLNTNPHTPPTRIYCSSEHLCTNYCPNKDQCTGLKTKLLIHATVLDQRQHIWYPHEYLNTISITRADHLKALNIEMIDILRDFNTASRL
ncbi:hypothetical protein [Bacteroides sp.]|uniref:hypothetical protein n=1 Tax=Bacteroides sp. TaxID=29523 RepID=UPI0026262359|nr:hypothetical protein [Bacteroides sp.]MDD3039016.1 hypothetical protein [Bacteroides sp.]